MENTSKFKFYTLTDGAHSQSLAAAEGRSESLYHQESKAGSNLRDVAQWRFDAVGEHMIPGQTASAVYYRIIDKRFGCSLAAGEARPDNLVYHQNPDKRSNARWRVTPANEEGFWILRDGKHDLALVGGDIYDGKIYHQAPGTRGNAMWRIDLASGNGVGPQFLPESEVVETMTFLPEKIEPRGERTRASVSTQNGGSTPLEDTLKVELGDTIESNWSASDSVSESVSREIGLKLRAEKKFATAKVGVEASYKVTVTTENTRATAKGETHTTELRLSFEKKVTVPPLTNKQMEVTLDPRSVITPFQATVLTRYADGSETRRKVNGTLEVRDFVTNTKVSESPSVPAS